jgi:sugar phosphate isomerase/epimerase
MVKDFSIQLYMLKEYTEKSFPAVLEKLGKLGYTGVEFAGYGNIPSGEMRSLLEAHTLKPVGTHVGVDSLKNNWEEERRYNKEIGTDYIIVPRTEMKTLEDALAFAKTLREFSAKVKGAGFNFAYHNHGYEFNSQGGKYFLDAILDEVPAEEMDLELDLFWLPNMGVAYKQWIEKYHSRIKLLHIKQIADSQGKITVDLGPGFIDYPWVFEHLQNWGAKHFILEQDEFKESPWVSAENAIRYVSGR